MNLCAELMSPFENSLPGKARASLGLGARCSSRLHSRRCHRRLAASQKQPLDVLLHLPSTFGIEPGQWDTRRRIVMRQHPRQRSVRHVASLVGQPCGERLRVDADVTGQRWRRWRRRGSHGNIFNSVGEQNRLEEIARAREVKLRRDQPYGSDARSRQRRQAQDGVAHGGV